MLLSPLFCGCVKSTQYICVCVCYPSDKWNTEDKHTLISRCRKNIWQNFTWIHNLKKNSSERPAASALSWESCKEPCFHPFNNKGTDWLQTHKVPGQNHRASTGLIPRVASCLQGEERCQPDSAPWATTLWGRIGEGLCTDWQAGGRVTAPGGPHGLEGPHLLTDSSHRSNSTSS